VPETAAAVANASCESGARKNFVALIQAVPTSISGVLIFEPQVFGDECGFLLVSWNARDFRDEPVFSRKIGSGRRWGWRRCAHEVAG
jgi:hypothetical protein